jgi:hypothetical protein
VLLNRGDGTFAPQVQYGAPFPFSITSADLDGDGDADLATGNGLNGTVSVFLNTCSCSAASWQNYGSGWPGTHGVPSFTAASNPRLCATVTLSLENSLGASTTAVLVGGVLQIDQPTMYGGHLLVVPRQVFLLPVPAAGLSLSATLPCDSALCGLSIDLQVLETDPGASKGLSFTPGLQLVLGM